MSMFENHKHKIAAWAVYDCDLEVLEEALEVGVDPDEKIGDGMDEGRCLMEVAIFEGEAEVVRFLLEHGGNPNGKTKNGIEYKKVADEEILALLNEYSI